MKKSPARSFVMIMVVVAVSALLLRFGLEKLIEINISQNESNAQVSLKLISAALENYAKDNRGLYPTSLSVLSQAIPPYLDKEDSELPPTRGYIYSCTRLDTSGYSCNAAPIRCKLGGKMVFTITTGSLLVSEECEKKE